MNEERRKHIINLAEENNVPVDIAFMYAELLGENEDYDGLVSTMEDHEYMSDLLGISDVSDEIDRLSVGIHEGFIIKDDNVR